MRQRIGGLRQRLAMRCDQPPGQPRRRGHGDLLPEHGADRQLEAVPGARHAQSRPRCDQRCEGRILGEMRRDGARIGGEIEDPPQPRDDRAAAPTASGNRSLRASACPSAGRTETVPCMPLDVASFVTYRSSRRRFDAGNGPRGAGSRASPASHRVADSAAAELTSPRGPAGDIRPARAPQRARRTLNSGWNVSLKRRMLPKPDANAISAIGRRVSWMSCLASRTRRVWATRDRRGAQMLPEQPPQLALANAEPTGQRHRPPPHPERRARSAPARATPCSRCRARRPDPARFPVGSAGTGGTRPPVRPRRSG